MIGNDIIDLTVAEQESRIRRKGFLEKLFLPGEIQWILQSNNPAVSTWLLWSCKEAVYKMIHRTTRDRRYAPHRFSCQVFRQEGEEAAGVVQYEQYTGYFHSVITPGYIHTCAGPAPTSPANMDVYIERHENLPAVVQANQQLLQHLLSEKEVFYKDKDGIPFVLQRDTGREMPVSVSHHGRYIGFVKPVE